MMDFLTFLVWKLWPKCRKLINEITANPWGDSGNIWHFLAITLNPEMLESRSRALKTRIIVQNPRKNWVTKLAHWMNRWRYKKEPQNLPQSCQQPKTSNLKLSTFRAAWFRRFLQKNSSFRLPYQCPSSSAHCARELFSGSNGSASRVTS